MARVRETDLGIPVKRLFEDAGYTVRSEVDDCDLVAVKDDHVVAAELKRAFNLELLLQGVDRQKRADHVYIVFPRPKRKGRRWSQIRHLCRRLELGIMTVDLSVPDRPRVDVVSEPGTPGTGRSTAARTRLLREVAGRSGDYNVGGSNKRPLVTAYRERALRIAHVLATDGPLPLRQIRQTSGDDKAASILQKNYYDWFDRVQRGVYDLSPLGRQACDVYADVIAGWGGDSP